LSGVLRELDAKTVANFSIGVSSVLGV